MIIQATCGSVMDTEVVVSISTEVEWILLVLWTVLPR